MDDELLLRALTEHATQKELDAVATWRSVSSDNAHRYSELQETLAAAAAWYASLEPIPPPSADGLIRQADLRTAAAEEAQPARTDGLGKRGYRRAGLISAAAAVLIMVGFTTARSLRRASGPAPEIAGLTSGVTGIAIATLKDGTIIRLGPKSRLSVAQSADAREVWLEGRAEFSVVRMERRPFRVHTSFGQIEDLGTRFLARTDGGEMRVAVFEGRASVTANGASIELDAGDVGAVAAGGQPRATRHGDVHSSNDWLRSAVVFEGETLEQVAAELQRRYGYRVRITDPALAQHTVSAWFIDPPTAGDVITSICRVVGARCDIRDSSAVVSAPRQ